MITARGCPYSCIFCASAAIWKKKVRFHSIPYVIKQVNRIKDLGVKHFFFCNDTFLMNPNRSYLLLEEIKKLNIIWRCSVNTNTLTPELTEAMFDSGCRQVDFGIESGSDKMLKIMKKPSNVKQHESAIRTARKAGMITKCMLMVGLPGETDEDIEETISFIRRNDSDMYALTVFMPFPGCDIAENIDKYNLEFNSLSYEDYYVTGATKETPIAHIDKKTIARRRDMIWEAIGNKSTLDVILSRERQHQNV